MRTQKNNSVEEINCSNTDLSLDRSQENLETETNIAVSTENINTSISNNNNNNNNLQLEKIQQFVTMIT